MDWQLRLRDSFSNLYNYYSHLFLSFLIIPLIGSFSVIAVVFCCLDAFCLRNRYLFVLFFFLGCVAIFAANPSWTLVILKTSPQDVRSLAVGIATIMYHFLGDVPSPIIIGKLIDVWVGRAGDDPAKKYQAYYMVLQLVLFMSIIVVGLIETGNQKVLMWGLGYLLTYIKEFKKQTEATPPVFSERQSVLEDNLAIVAVSQKTMDTLSESVVFVQSDDDYTPHTPKESVCQSDSVI